MIFTKEEILQSLQEKANEKIEEIRHELAQTLFEAVSTDGFFVYDEKEGEVIGGPFKTFQQATKYAANMEDEDSDLKVYSSREIAKKVGA